LEYVIDGNRPGTVYACPDGTSADVRETLIEEGSAPYIIEEVFAKILITKGEESCGVWELRSAPEWWYNGGRIAYEIHEEEQ
jgi:hypothetical protein